VGYMKSTGKHHPAAATLLTELKCLYGELDPDDREQVRSMLSDLFAMIQMQRSKKEDKGYEHGGFTRSRSINLEHRSRTLRGALRVKHMFAILDCSFDP